MVYSVTSMILDYNTESHTDPNTAGVYGVVSGIL